MPTIRDVATIQRITDEMLIPCIRDIALRKIDSALEEARKEAHVKVLEWSIQVSEMVKERGLLVDVRFE